MGFLSIGIVLVFGIILAPVVILILASIFGKPRNLRVTGIFLGMFAGLMIMGIALVWLLTMFLGFLIP